MSAFASCNGTGTINSGSVIVYILTFMYRVILTISSTSFIGATNFVEDIANIFVLRQRTCAYI